MPNWWWFKCLCTKSWQGSIQNVISRERKQAELQQFWTIIIMHGVLKWQCKNTKYSLRSSLQRGKLGDYFSTQFRLYWSKTSKIFAFFSLPSCRIQWIFCMVWPGVNRGLPDTILFDFFVKSTNLCKPVTCTRSITFELPLKGILNIYMNIPVFPHEMLSICGQFSLETFTVFLAYFEISNQKHHSQTGYNYNILIRIIDNLLGRNTTRITWKFLQYGD